MTLLNMARIKRLPRTAQMLVNVELGQIRSRGLRRYWSMKAKELQVSRSGDLPQAVQIEPYGGCNIRCTMCFQGRLNLPSDTVMMDLVTYRQIIDNVSPYTSRLYLYWRGESLLNPHLGEMIQYARQKNMYVFLSTNAVTLDLDKGNELIDAGLDFLLIALDGATPQSYEYMRRGAKFPKVLQNIESFIQLKRQRRSPLPHVCLQMIVSSVNQHELPLFHALAQRIGANSTIERVLDLYENFDNEKIHRATRKLFVQGLWSKYMQEGDIYKVSEKIVTCDMAKRLVVRSDGRLSLCCYDLQERYPIGSAVDGDVMKLWSADQYATLRSSGQKRQLDLCKNCGAGIQR